MKVTFKTDDDKKLNINIEFDSYDPKNESLKDMVLESIKKNIKKLVCAINDELYKAKQQEDKLRKEIDEKQKQIEERRINE